MKILIIEDNHVLARNISRFFDMEWIKSEVSNDWKEWLEKALMYYFDLIVLDINLPWMDWIQICEELRKKEKNIPILMLTSRSWDWDVVKWLNSWADDYLTKPFDLDVLLARVNALVRRNLKNKTKNIEINFFENDWEDEKNKIKSEINLNINFDKNEVLKNWEIIKLSHLEFNLLKLLIQNKWKVLTRSEIFDKVWWDFDEYMFSRNVDIYVWYLRKKIWKNFIKTKKWVWYLVN